MPTKNELLSIIAAYGLGRALPPGSTRAAALAATKGIVKSGRIVVPAAARTVGPPVGRGAMALARRNPYVAAGLLGYGAYEAGLLDPVIETGQDVAEEQVVIPLTTGKRSVRSKFNQAVSVGIKAVKASKYNGKKGEIKNSKAAFSAATTTASKIQRGSKTGKTGVTATIARAIRRSKLLKVKRVA